MKYFTVDLEEWWGGESFKNFLAGASIPTEDRMNEGLDIFLKLLRQYEQKATFFILGRVAAKYPDLVPKLISEGHHIATHGYDHELVYNQTPAEFEADLLASMTILSKQSGQDIIHYRAPSYSITSRSLWAIEILRKNGIRVDSSISPAQNKRFGILGAPEFPYTIDTAFGSLLELPPNVIKLGKSLPITSGIAFRFFPQWLIHNQVKKFEKKGIHTMFIFHNWETDIDQPVLKVGIKSKLIHYYGIGKMEARLASILKKYTFDKLPESGDKEIQFTINNQKLERKN